MQSLLRSTAHFDLLLGPLPGVFHAGIEWVIVHEILTPFVPIATNSWKVLPSNVPISNQHMHTIPNVHHLTIPERYHAVLSCVVPPFSP